MRETIFALSTVPGLSAIAVFRISGPNAFSVLRNITRGNIPKNIDIVTLEMIPARGPQTNYKQVLREKHLLTMSVFQFGGWA